jgi:hypothetical protein
VARGVTRDMAGRLGRSREAAQFARRVYQGVTKPFGDFRAGPPPWEQQGVSVGLLRLYSRLRAEHHTVSLRLCALPVEERLNVESRPDLTSVRICYILVVDH